MKIIFPILNLVLAGALFFFVTDPMLVKAPLAEDHKDITQSVGGIQALLARKAVLEEAVQKGKTAGKKIDELNGTYNFFARSDLERLDLLLPDHVDNIQLIIDVNGIAKRNNMSIKNIKFSADDEAENGGQRNASYSAAKPAEATNPRLGILGLSFNVTGTYEAYKSFLDDLARSLRIIDISSSSFGTDDKGVYSYSVELKTYWLK